MELIEVKDNGETYYVFLNKKYKVVELPSKYILSIHNHGSRYSPKSVKHYSKVLLYFIKYLEKNYDMQVDLSVAVIDGVGTSNYLKKLKSDGLAAATIRNREAIIREFMTWLTSDEAGRVRDNNGYASSKYKSPNPTKKIPRYLTVFEIIEFINLLHDESQRCLVHFLFDSGLRRSEVARLKKNDIPRLQDFPEEAMYFDLKISNGSKGPGGMPKERNTFLTRAMISRINRLHKQHPIYRKARREYGDDMPCFLNVKGKPITKNAIKNLLYKAPQRGGLNPSKYSAHKFRHSFAVSVLMSEFDKEFLNKLVIVRDALGHKDIETTEKYGHIPPAAIKNLQLQNEQHDIHNRFEESQHLYDETYLPMKKHTEKRGRK